MDDGGEVEEGGGGRSEGTEVGVVDEAYRSRSSRKGW